MTNSPDHYSNPVRDAFENRIRQLAEAGLITPALDRATDGSYLDVGLQMRWHGWQMAHDQPKPAPVGEAQFMVGTDTVTAAFFNASTVPPGTRVYIDPPRHWTRAEEKGAAALLSEARAVLDLMLCGDPSRRFGDFENGDGEIIGARMDALHEGLRDFLALHDDRPKNSERPGASSSLTAAVTAAFAGAQRNEEGKLVLDLDDECKLRTAVDAAAEMSAEATERHALAGRRWEAVEHGSSDLTLRIHYTQPGLRAAVVDKHVAMSSSALSAAQGAANA